MNASYRLNTCKSRGSEGAAMPLSATGARVSNAYPTCPWVRDKLPKGSLIPDVVRRRPLIFTKDFGRRWMGMRTIRQQAG